MRQRHAQGKRESARATLVWCNIHVGAQYSALSKRQIEALQKSMEHARYTAPPDRQDPIKAFFDQMQRYARIPKE